jgi:hypothetical protein
MAVEVDATSIGMDTGLTTIDHVPSAGRSGLQIVAGDDPCSMPGGRAAAEPFGVLGAPAIRG